MKSRPSKMLYEVSPFGITQKTKGKETAPILELQPFDMIGIDYIGPIAPISHDGCRYICVVVDYFTRFVILEAVRSYTSAATANFVYHRVFSIFGVPGFCILTTALNFRVLLTAS